MVNRLEVIKKFKSICYINSQNDIIKIRIISVDRGGLNG